MSYSSASVCPSRGLWHWLDWIKVNQKLLVRLNKMSVLLWIICCQWSTIKLKCQGFSPQVIVTWLPSCSVPSLHCWCFVFPPFWRRTERRNDNFNYQFTVHLQLVNLKQQLMFSLNCLEIESKTSPTFLAHPGSAVKAHSALFLPQAVSSELKARLAFVFKRLMEIRWVPVPVVVVSVQNMHLSPCRAKKSLFVL